MRAVDVIIILIVVILIVSIVYGSSTVVYSGRGYSRSYFGRPRHSTYVSIGGGGYRSSGYRSRGAGGIGVK